MSILLMKELIDCDWRKSFDRYIWCHKFAFTDYNDNFIEFVVHNHDPYRGYVSAMNLIKCIHDTRTPYWYFKSRCYVPTVRRRFTAKCKKIAYVIFEGICIGTPMTRETFYNETRGIIGRMTIENQWDYYFSFVVVFE